MIRGGQGGGQGAVELTIDALVVETELERDQSERLGAVLELAFTRLAAALRRAPGGQLARLQDLVLDSLELELEDPERLLGPGGADWLAARLLDQLLARTPARGDWP